MYSICFCPCIYVQQCGGGDDPLTRFPPGAERETEATQSIRLSLFGFQAEAEEYFQRYPLASADMEAASLAHGVASPLSPREGMIKNVSLESLQLCERDGKKPLSDCKLDRFIHACFPLLANLFRDLVYFETLKDYSNTGLYTAAETNRLSHP